MIFIQNKYTRCYNLIIDRARSRTLDSYAESHHIIPESFFINRTRKGSSGWVLGNPNDPTNIVNLTAREHFICHLLLPKMVIGPGRYKMLRALLGISVLRGPGQERVTITSRRYAQLVEQLSTIDMPANIRENYIRDAKIRSEKRKQQGLSGTFKGRKHSENTLIKMRIPKTEEQKLHHSQIMKGKNLGKIPFNKNKSYEELYGTKRSLEIKEKIKHIGEKNGFFGKQHSPEQRQKKSQEKLAAPKLVCYHCNKKVDPMNYSRWHGDKCKELIGPIKTGQRLKKECPHCGKFAGPGLFERYHDDNCKQRK